MGYGLAADGVVAIHVGFMAFVVVGQLFILVGVVAGWQCVRNFWFRCSHLLAIGIVAVETVANVQCPLTVWERDLRALAGQPVSEATFVGRILHNILVYDLPYDHWLFTVSYLTFFALVVTTFVLAPPRRRPAMQPLQAIASHSAS